MKTIKKICHILCAIAFSALFAVAFAYALRYIYLYYYKIDLFLPQTYAAISAYWNSGATLRGEDFLLLMGIFMAVPVNIVVWIIIFHMRFAPLITTPLSWLGSLGIGEYKAPVINIKNLKVEEKKTLEQVVQERIDIEKKKNPQPDSGKFRQDIIEKIEEEKNNQN